MTPPWRIVVMAKAPLAGYAKTRLVPALGTDGAARLAHRLLEHALAQALEADLGPVELCAAPAARHPAFDPWRAWPLQWGDQGDGDLGQRMGRAIRRALGVASRVLLIGTDAPALDATALRDAARALATCDAVFVPALDGGYALIGVTRPAESLFDGVAWGTARVMAQTRDRLRAGGWTHRERPAVADVDEPADLVHIPAGWMV